MPRASGISVENSFIGGLFTESTGLNFPENACTDTLNCKFNKDGSVERRQGLDFENNYSTKAINRSNVAVNTYLWRNVAGNGDFSVLVVQVGNTIYFYKTNTGTLSGGALLDTVQLAAVNGAPIPDSLEAQFADGNGLLFITHPYCDPMYVAYDTNTDTVTETTITIKIRDFEGDTLDPYAVDFRPTSSYASLDVHHKYNILNQGWVATTNVSTWDSSRSDMPSNVDVPWTFKNASDVFDITTVNNVVRGNTPAPKGHYILPLADQDRETASGLSGVQSSGTGARRPSTAAFFAGRIFYTGIGVTKYNNNIYFSQVAERYEQYAFCYQVNDPTAEDLFDLLPTDGGVIVIQDAGTIFKLVSIPGGMAVLAANGVWFITGSQGLGFTANDYTVQKISSIGTLSAASVVDVGGLPSWWNAEGIYMLSTEGNLPKVVPISHPKIKTFYESIPVSAKRFARGFFNLYTGDIKWIYNTEATSQLTDIYSFDRVLNYNIYTGAFYPWTISSSDVKINGIVVSDATAGDISTDQVIDASSNSVTDASSNNVVVFNAFNLFTTPGFKFLVSYPNASTYLFTFAEERNTDYLDWFQRTITGVDYDSYFITGYKIRGQGINRQQNNYINIFSELSTDIAYYLQGLWDYSTSGNTGRWSSRQLIQEDETDEYSVKFHKRKIRGHGKVLQFKVESFPGKNFNIIGWSTFDSSNQLP